MVSIQAPENLWNYQGNYHVVTAREILGLEKFGYQRKVLGNKTLFECVDKSAADNASLRSYQSLMEKENSLGESSVTKLIFEPSHGLNKDIQSFDFSKHSRLAGADAV